MLQEKFAEMRFADARVTTYEAYLAFAALGSVPQCQQLLQFLIATDEPRNPLWPHRLKAALYRSPPGDYASVHRIGSSGKLMRCEILANENEFFLEHIVEPHAILRYQCSPHHLNSPFYPVISQLKHAMGFEHADTTTVKFEKLDAALSQVLEPTKENKLLFAALLSIEPQRELSSGLTPQRQKDLIIAALIRYILSQADKRPLVIVLADAHWIDSSTLELVNRIIPLIKKAQVFSS